MELKIMNPEALKRLAESKEFYPWFYCSKCEKEHTPKDKVFIEHAAKFLAPLPEKEWRVGIINKAIIDNPEMITDLAVGTDLTFEMAEKYKV